MTVSISTDDMRSLIARSIRRRPMRYWFSMSSPTERTRRLPRLSMSSISPRPVAQLNQHLDDGEDVVLAQDAHGVRRVERKTAVHLDAADRRKVVALAIEEEAVEKAFRGFKRRRLAGTHDAVDVDERLLAALVLVDGERIADEAADIEMVDVERRDLG